MPPDNKRHWEIRFPDPNRSGPGGLVAYGGDLTPLTLLSAYGQGIFPWYSESEPILWWSPDPRCVLFPDCFHISARSRRKISNSGFAFSIDRAFKEVMIGCAMPRKYTSETWLIPEMQEAYAQLFELGFAHSVEIWQSGRLVGGIYGVVIGRIFFGESMFRMVPEGSRAALLCLIELMLALDMPILDCQLPSPHMLAMGASNLGRPVFLEVLPSVLSPPVTRLEKGCWRKFEAVLGERNGIRLAKG